MTTALVGGFFLKHPQIKTRYLNCIVHLAFCRSTKKGGKMRQSTFLALLLVSLWTSLIAFALYSFDAHLHYRELTVVLNGNIIVSQFDSLKEFSERKI